MYFVENNRAIFAVAKIANNNYFADMFFFLRIFANQWRPLPTAAKGYNTK